MACTELDTLDSGAVVSLGGQSSRNWWAPGAPGGDEHRRPPAAPGPQGLVGALLKFPGPQAVPPAAPARTPTGVPRQQWPCREAMSALLRVPEPAEGSGSSPHQGLLGEGEPPGPRSLSTAPIPQHSWFPPHSAGGLRSLFISVSQWLWLKAGWSLGTSGGRVSSGSSHRLLSRDHLYC